MDIIAGLAAVIAALVSGIFYFKAKSGIAEALNQNEKTKEQLLEKDKQLASNNAQLDVEEQKRNELKNSPKVDNSNIVDFFINRK